MDALDAKLLDISTFEQILVCDEGEDDHEFSKSVVYQFIEQADQTIPQLQKLLDERRLDELSKRGHFLKGSSAQLGIKRVREQCELIQHYAALEDFKNNHKALTREEAVDLLEATMQRLKDEYHTSRKYLKQLYGDESPDTATDTDTDGHGGIRKSAPRAPPPTTPPTTQIRVTVQSSPVPSHAIAPTKFSPSPLPSRCARLDPVPISAHVANAALPSRGSGPGSAVGAPK